MQQLTSTKKKWTYVALSSTVVMLVTAVLITSCSLFGNKAPEAPSNLSGTVLSSTEIELSWRDNSDDETGFLIEYGTSSGDLDSAKRTDENEEEYVISGLDPATTYYFTVRAEGERGDSEPTNVVSVTTLAAGDTTAPTIPANLTATAVSSTQIDLSWNPSTDNVGVLGYRVYRNGVFLKTVPGTSTEDTGLAPSTTYSYTVAAYDAAGNQSAQSTAANATTFSGGGTPPADPTGLSATALSSSSIELTWTDNSSDEDGFDIYRSLSSGSGYSELDTVGANVESYTDDGLDPDTTYYYRVYAYNSYGDSDYTYDYATTDPTGSPPADPTGLSATVLSSSSIYLSWTDNSSDEDGFDIYRSLSSGSGYSELDTVGANVESYTDDGLDPDTTYYYRVYAYNSYGDSDYAYDYATTDPTGSPPADPTGLSATALSSSSIQLTWNDNSSDEDGFDIYRSLSSGSGYSEIDTVDPNVESFIDDGLDPDTTYYYRVYAYNSYGDSDYTYDYATTDSAPTVIYEEHFDGAFDNPDDWYFRGGSDFSENYSTGFWAVPALGSHCYAMGGGFGSLDVHLFTEIGTLEQPSRVQIYVRPSYTNQEGGIVALTGDYYIGVSYFGSDGDIYIIEPEGSTSIQSYSADTWYKIEFRNIDWTNKEYDFYVNDSLRMTNASFTSTSATGMSELRMQNWDSGSEFGFDEIVIEE
jgi:chitodextrinase